MTLKISVEDEEFYNLTTVLPLKEKRHNELEACRFEE